MASPLRKWMRKEQVYDVDLEAKLGEIGIENPPDDFKNITAKQWDEVVREIRVNRFKELKDQDSRNRLDKKLKKIEKIWREQSGVKSTSIKKGGKGGKGKKKGKGGKEEKKSEESPELKKWMKKDQIFEPEVYKILCDRGIKTKEELFDSLKTNKQWDELLREVRVRRNKTLKDNDAKLRADKLMVKIEKQWRKATGIKKTAVTKNTGKGGNKPTPTDKKNEEMAGKGAELKKWMRKEQIWLMRLFEELLKNGIESPDSLAQLSEEEFDEIIRVVRVDRFKELKDQNSRNRCDKLLITFEKKWRAASGVKKTSIKD